MLARRWGVVGLVAVVGAFGLSMAACGGDDSSGDPAPAPTGGGQGTGGSGTGGSGQGTGGTGTGGTSTGAGGTSTGAGGTDPGTGGSSGDPLACEKATPPTCGNTPDPELPPDPDPGATPADPAAPAVWHAVHALYLGDTTREDITTADEEAWRKIGFDLDGKFSETPNWGGHCKPVDGASKSTIITDGDNGIDNSFGRNVLPLLSSFLDAPTQAVTDQINEGNFTIVMKLEGVGTGASYSGVTAQLFAAGGVEDAGGNIVAPTDWATYKWEPFYESVTAASHGGADPTMYESVVKFPSAYVANNVFVSGGKTDLELKLAIQGFEIALGIKKALVEGTLAADRASMTNGTIGGILVTEELINTLRKVAGSVSPSLCEGTTFDGIAQTIEQASDILADGTQDGAQTCNAISIGIGFDSKTSSIGEHRDQSPPSDPCANP